MYGRRRMIRGSSRGSSDNRRWWCHGCCRRRHRRRKSVNRRHDMCINPAGRRIDTTMVWRRGWWWYRRWPPLIRRRCSCCFMPRHRVFCGHLNGRSKHSNGRGSGRLRQVGVTEDIVVVDELQIRELVFIISSKAVKLRPRRTFTCRRRRRRSSPFSLEHDRADNSKSHEHDYGNSQQCGANVPERIPTTAAVNLLLLLLLLVLEVVSSSSFCVRCREE